MKFRVQLALLLFVLLLICGCGKVTQTIGQKEPSRKDYAEIKGVIDPVPTENIVDEFVRPTKNIVVEVSRLSPEDRTIYVSLHSMDNAGELKEIAWGMGQRPKAKEIVENVLFYSLDKKERKLDKATDGNIYVEWVPGSRPHWEYTITQINDIAPYFIVNVINEKKDHYLAMPVDGLLVTADRAINLTSPTKKSTLISRIVQTVEKEDGVEVQHALQLKNLDEIFTSLAVFYSGWSFPSTEIQPKHFKMPNTVKKQRDAELSQLMTLRSEGRSVYLKQLNTLDMSEQLIRHLERFAPPEVAEPAPK